MLRYTTFCLVLLTVPLIAVGLPSQGSTIPPSDSSKDSTKTGIEVRAENAWMLVPTQSATRNTIVGSIRAERDRFWDDAIGAHDALTKTNVQHAVSEGSWSTKEAEVPKIPNRAILTAAFTSYRGILTASERSIYTEVILHVQSTFEVTAGDARPNWDITVCIPGGTVVAPTGSVITSLTQPREFSLQPGRTYLLVLSYEPSGDFYTVGDDWDISGGTVRINSVRSKFFSNRSALDGLTTEQLAPALHRLLAEETR